MYPDEPKESPFATTTLDNEASTPKAFFADLIKFTIIALVIVAPVRWYVAQPFIVNGSSMDPTFHDGDYLIISELTYHFQDPARGQVIIFKYPKDPSKYFIKRVVGLPLEKIIIDNGKVSILTAGQQTPTQLDEPYLVYTTSTNLRITLGPDEYFVMGDNRPASSDSRVWGPVQRKEIIGTVFLRLFPFDKIGVQPGDAS